VGGDHHLTLRWDDFDNGYAVGSVDQHDPDDNHPLNYDPDDDDPEAEEAQAATPQKEKPTPQAQAETEAVPTVSRYERN
jgi:hypothetical protein